MRIYTTCPACGFLLFAADADTHPACPPVMSASADIEKAYLEHLAAGEDGPAAALAEILDAPRSPRLLDAALVYASWGWAVFPCAPGRKGPLTKHGFKDATTDPAKIRAWWAATPQANIGLPTGHRFDVIDIDAPTGWYSYLTMADADALPDIHGWASTPRGGAHLYVQAHPGRRNATGTMSGIDIRAEGGYVVAPPSVDGRGFAYLWRHKPSPVIADCGRRVPKGAA